LTGKRQLGLRLLSSLRENMDLSSQAPQEWSKIAIVARTYATRILESLRNVFLKAIVCAHGVGRCRTWHVGSNS
jgi:hypothetical protein